MRERLKKKIALFEHTSRYSGGQVVFFDILSALLSSQKFSITAFVPVGSYLIERIKSYDPSIRVINFLFFDLVFSGARLLIFF